MALLGYGQNRRAYLDNALKRLSAMYVITDCVPAPCFANAPEVAPAEASTPVGTPSDRRRPGRLEQVTQLSYRYFVVLLEMSILTWT